MPELIAHLTKTGVLRSPEIIQALREIDRADFVPENLKHRAYEDTALPIEGGQTISQPYTVVFMLEQLQVKPGNKILDIGYGSCWQTALLSYLTGPSGKVCAFEVSPTLCRIGKANLEKYPQLAKRTALICASAQDGYPEEAPFDRIVSAAEVLEVPQSWRTQLATGGRLLYPKRRSLVLEIKRNESFETREFLGFAFVPFVSKRIEQ